MRRQRTSASADPALADVTATDRLPAVVAVPAQRRATTLPLPVVAVRQRRRRGEPLSVDEQRAADVLDWLVREPRGDAARVAYAYRVPVAALARARARLSEAADAYSAHPAHRAPCARLRGPEPVAACTATETCDAHLLPLQEWWDALHAHARALVTLARAGAR